MAADKNFPLEKVHDAIAEYNKIGGGHKVRCNPEPVDACMFAQVQNMHGGGRWHCPLHIAAPAAATSHLQMENQWPASTAGVPGRLNAHGRFAADAAEGLGFCQGTSSLMELDTSCAAKCM